MTDQHNKIEMSLHKLGFFEEVIENIRQNQSMLDFCENVCNRQIETQICLHRVNRLIAKGKTLHGHIAKQPQKHLGVDVIPLNANWQKDSCKEMLIRLNEVFENMNANMTAVSKIKQSHINVESHTDLQASLSDLAYASTRCKNANRVISDMTNRFCQLYVLSGCYGRTIHTEPLFE